MNRLPNKAHSLGDGILMKDGIDRVVNSLEESLGVFASLRETLVEAEPEARRWALSRARDLRRLVRNVRLEKADSRQDAKTPR